MLRTKMRTDVCSERRRRQGHINSVCETPVSPPATSPRRPARGSMKRQHAYSEGVKLGVGGPTSELAACTPSPAAVSCVHRGHIPSTSDGHHAV